MKNVIGALLALSAGFPAVAGEVFLGTPAEHLVMGQIEPVNSETDLIGGTAATAGEYPGVFYTRQGSSRCTGTLVGNQVVATASHCVSNGGTLSLDYNGKTFSGRCTHSSLYRGNSTADWALCKLTEAVPDQVAESVNTDGARLNVGAEIVLMGYGCIRAGGSGGNDGTLRVGKAPIRQLPSGRSYDIVTVGSSALCYGDSGGPSFVVDEATGKRYQTGINSRGDISRTSYLSALHTDAAQEFYRDWAEQNGVKICGIHADAEGCRQSETPDPELPAECKVVREKKSHEVLRDCALAKNRPEAAACQGALDDVQACLTARDAE